MHFRPPSAVLGLLVILSGPSAVAAGPPAGVGGQAPAGSADSADTLFKSGKAAMDRGDLGAACPMFAESQRLDPAPGTLLNLGECEARSGKLATALAHFKEARATLPADDFRVAFADEKVAALAKRVPRLTIRVTGTLPESATVERNGLLVTAGTLGVAVPVDPGRQVVTLTDGGRVLARVEVTLDEGRSETAELDAGAAPFAPAAFATSNTQRTAGLVLMGSGAASLVLGTVLGLAAKVQYDSADTLKNCPAGPNSCNAAGVQGGQTAHTEATVSTCAFVAGALLAAGGGAVYLTAPKERGGVALSPAFDSRGAGVLVQGTW